MNLPQPILRQSLLDVWMLNSYDVVVLGEMSLTAGDVTMLTNCGKCGGTLIALRPDASLNTLMGISAASGTLSDKYLFSTDCFRTRIGNL